MAGLRPHLQPLSFPHSPAAVNPVGLPQRRPPPAPSTPPRSVLNEAKSQKEKEKKAQRPRQYMPPTPGQHSSTQPPKRFTFDSLSKMKSEMAKKANPTPYSPYENEMQRAQAADRAQRFLESINGGRPSGRKTLSDRQLLPVKDHRSPQSLKKMPLRATSHGSNVHAVAHNLRTANSRQQLAKGDIDNGEAVQLPLIISPTFQHTKGISSSDDDFRLSRCVSDQRALMSAVATLNSANRPMDRQSNPFSRRQSNGPTNRSPGAPRPMAIPRRSSRESGPPPEPMEHLIHEDHEQRFQPLGYRPPPQRHSQHRPQPYGPRGPQPRPTPYRGPNRRQPRDHMYAQYAGSLAPRRDGGIRVYDAALASYSDHYPSPQPRYGHGGDIYADYYSYAVDDGHRLARGSSAMLDDESGDSFDAEMFEDRYHSEYAMAPRSSRVTYPRRPSRVLDDRSRDPQSARGQLQRYERISTPKTDAIQKIIIQVDNTRLRDAYKCTIMLRLVDTNRDRKKSKILDNMPQCTEMSGVSDCPQFQRNAFCFKLSAPLSKDSCEKIVLRVMRQGEGAAKTEHGVGVLQLSMAADNVKHAGSYTKTVTFTMKSAKAADGDVYIGSTDVSVGKIANF